MVWCGISYIVAKTVILMFDYHLIAGVKLDGMGGQISFVLGAIIFYDTSELEIVYVEVYRVCTYLSTPYLGR